MARNRNKLDGYVCELASDGIDAVAYTADLTDRVQAVDLLNTITDDLGPVEVLEYGPGPLDARVVPAREVDVADLEPMLDLRLRTPVALARAALPSMLERGSGGLLFAFGSQPRHPDPALDNVGIAQAALLHHVHNLHTSLASDGIYGGAVLIGALIEGSEIQQLLRTGNAAHLPDDVAQRELPIVDPARIAEVYWDMYVRRDRVEELVV